MKSFLLVVLVFIITCINLLGQNSRLRGIITEGSRKGNPIENVSITASGANQVVTNTEGRFEMIFPFKTPGDVVSISVHKEGYSVLNETMLNSIAIRKDMNEIVHIILTKDGELDKTLSAFIKQIDKNYINKLAILSNKINDTETEKQSLADSIAILNEMLNPSKEAARKIVYTDTNNLDLRMRRSYQKLYGNDINGAIKILENSDLEASILKANALKNKGLQYIDEAEILLEKGIEEAIYLARLALMAFDFSQADRYYLMAYEANKNHKAIAFE